jgi:hypothetical protein
MFVAKLTQPNPSRLRSIDSSGQICVLYDKRPSAFGDAVMVAAAEVVNDMGPSALLPQQHG